ncbi:MAG: kelch repeat-containing protein [Phycisphaerae bacterium]
MMGRAGFTVAGYLVFAGSVTLDAKPTDGKQTTVRVSVRRTSTEVEASRAAGSAAFDTKRGRMIIFSAVGTDESRGGGVLTTYDPVAERFNTIQTTGPSPTGVGHPSLVYDPKRDALLIFGGWADGRDGPTDEFWLLELGEAGRRSWRLLPRVEKGPCRRNGAVMVLDRERDGILLHGGDGGAHPKYGFTPLDDLWSYDLTSGEWKRLEPSGAVPPPRWNHCGAIDPRSGRLYLFGGVGYLPDERLVRDNDVFVLDLEKLVWTRRSCSGDCPKAAQGATLTFDTDARVLVLIGGLHLAVGGKSGTTSVWTYDVDAASWTEQREADRKYRRSHMAVYDPIRQQHVVHGGQTAWVPGNYYERGQPLHDTFFITVTRSK